MKHYSVATDIDIIQERLGGDGPGGIDFGDFGGGFRPHRWRVPNRTYRTGVLIFISAVVMMFAGLTSTIVVRQSAAPDWGHTAIPRILYLNTIVLLASSLTFELARRSLRSASASANLPRSTNYLSYLTMVLGLLFVVGQLEAWRTLVAHGVYLATNPSSSSFYLLTGFHGLHLLGGVLGLTYLVTRMEAMSLAKFRACLGATAMYWHFMGLLWLYILMLLVVRF